MIIGAIAHAVAKLLACDANRLPIFGAVRAEERRLVALDAFVETVQFVGAVDAVSVAVAPPPFPDALATAALELVTETLPGF